MPYPGQIHAVMHARKVDKERATVGVDCFHEIEAEGIGDAVS